MDQLIKGELLQFDQLAYLADPRIINDTIPAALRFKRLAMSWDITLRENY